jgi:hypothetical protein
MNLPSSANAISKPIYENFVLRLAALIAALTVVLTGIYKVFGQIEIISTAANIRILLVVLNCLVLTAFCFLATKVPVLNFISLSADVLAKYAATLNIRDTKKYTGIQQAKRNNDRVNRLVTQLNTNILLYAFFLILVYVLYIFEQTLSPSNEVVELKALFKSGQDIFNFLSSVFVYLAFKVLFNTTLDTDNRRTIYFVDAIFFSACYLTVYYLISENFFRLNDHDITIARHDLSLVSGIFNGLAMGLLFGRFISMEHVFMNNKNITSNKLLSYGTLFLLPLYVLAQPLFGSFEIDEFGDPKIFANIIFFICLIGKSFFLIIYFYYTQRRFLHLYLHLIVTRTGHNEDLSKCFDLGLNG